MKTEKQNTYKVSRIIDLLLIFILLVICVVAFYIAYTFQMIPMKWIHYASIVSIIVWIILCVLTIKKLPLWAKVIRRIFIILLCACFSTTGFLLQKSKNVLDKISTTTVNKDGTVTQKTELYIVVLKDSNIKSVADLSQATIGFQNGTDKENANYIKAQLEKEVSVVSNVEELDYTTLFNLLESGNIQALAISQSFYNMSSATITGFKDKVKILTTYEKEITKEALKKDISKDPFTIYISGLDSMGSPDQQTRSDTNLLLIVNPRANHIDMISLPRDGLMPNTALNNSNDKLTHTGIFGIDASVETIENFYGIPIDFYARVSFNSVIEIVDSIGGINVDVEISFCEQDENRSFAKDDLICLVKGEQKLNGKQALAYSRHRKTEGYDNAGRQRAQQRIIKAIISKLISPNAISYVNNLMEIAPNYIITNMPSNQISGFVSSELESLKPWTISSIATDYGVFDSRYVASLDPSYGLTDVYLFNKAEVQNVLNAYDGAGKQLQMNNFSFDLNNLYENSPALNDDPNIIWDTMADYPH